MQSLNYIEGVPSLASVQEGFWRGVRDQSEYIYPFISQSAKFLPHQRLEVYRTTARSAHISTLVDVFPVCSAILGERYFKQLAKQYFKQTPSLDPDLNQYGESFPGFLAKQIIVRAELNEFSYLVDLARLEWEWQGAYYSADEVLFDMQAFQSNCAAQGADVVLKLQASIRLLSSCYPVYQIWQSHREDKLRKKFDPIFKRQYLCVYKHQLQVHVKLIDPKLYFLLLSIKRGLTLGEITELFAGQVDFNSTLATVVKQQWLERSYIKQQSCGS